MQKHQTPTDNRSHAIVIGAGMAGLLTARALVNHFSLVTIIERDTLPKEPQIRPSVPQARHSHVLLLRGQRILEHFFPGLGTELTAAGVPKIDMGIDFHWLNAWGWASRAPSDLVGYSCSRCFLEWSARRRLTAHRNLQFLEATRVHKLLSNKDNSRVIGVQLRSRNDLENVSELAADLVVDTSGRHSSLPKWLKALGYSPPAETTVDSGLGYSSRWYEIPQGFQADWKIVSIGQNPPHERHGGGLSSVEGNRWLLTLNSVGSDYPPADEAGFLEFARTLRSPIIYEAIKHAKPLSPVYSYRQGKNRWRHYEKLSKFPKGLIAMGDSVCAFNPFYGQGMTVAALSALALDQFLCQQFQRSQGKSISGFTKRFQKQLANISKAPWLMSKRQDLCWPTTTGGTLTPIDRLLQSYSEQLLRLGTENSDVHQTLLKVVNMVEPTSIVFQPSILGQVLVKVSEQAISRKAVQTNLRESLRI